MKTVDEEMWDTMCKEIRTIDLHTWLRRKYRKVFITLEIARSQPDPGIVELVTEFTF